jgi:quercetin dioxygenase-like cupin family protein
MAVFRHDGLRLWLLQLEVDGLKNVDRTFLALLVISQLAGCSHHAADAQAGLTAPAEAAMPTRAEHPLIIAERAGESRTWRPLTGLPVKRTLSSFTIKIDEKNGGSPGLWIGTSSMPVGASIRLHRHLHEDEVLYIKSGIAHVQVGSLQGDADAGTLVFIPRNTWVSVKNVGKTPVSLLFEFNAPGFDRYMRCESVPAGEPAPPVNPSEDKHCAQLGDVEYR